MRVFGLIGFPLAHSFSESYFKEKFIRSGLDKQFQYLNFPIESLEQLKHTVLNYPGICGFNVTIPYKVAILQYLNKLDPVAQATGAVNTVVLEADIPTGRNILTGYNTDVPALKFSLQRNLKNPAKRAIILGTGGAAKAAMVALSELNISFTLVSRKSRNSITVRYDELTEDHISDADIILNCTPLGMFPSAESFPDIPYSAISSKHLLFDMVYNPQETQFLKKGNEKGAQTVNGMEMLYKQAELASEIWGIR